MQSDLALHLRVLRRKSGLTQADFAHLLGVHRTRVSHWEGGKTLPDPRDLCVMSLVFGRSIESLLAGLMVDARQKLERRLGTMPSAPRNWPGRINRVHALNALGARLETLTRHDNGAAA